MFGNTIRVFGLMVLALVFSASVSFAAPSVTNLLLNATSPYNLTDDNLTCNYALGEGATTSAVAWYRNNVPLMLLYLPMEGNSSNALLDYSGNGFAGTNSIPPASWGSSSGFNGNGAFYFNGVDSKITIARNSVLEPQYITVSLWMKSNGSQATWAKMLWYGMNDQDPWGPYGIDFNYSTPGEVEFHVAHNATTPKSQCWQVVEPGSNYTCDFVRVYSGKIINDSTWYHIVGTYDGSTVKLYVNGILRDSKPLSGPIGHYDTANGLALGERFQDNPPPFNVQQHYKGYLDDVRIYGRALTQDEISLLYSDTINLIVASATENCDQWQCSVTPFDPSLAGQTSDSNQLTTTCCQGDDSDNDDYSTSAADSGSMCCGAGRSTICQAGIDCDDGDPGIHPGATMSQSCGTSPCDGHQTRACQADGTYAAWGSCDSQGRDAGMCAICDANGNAVYDPSQNGDCPPTACGPGGCNAGACGEHIYGTYPENIPNTCAGAFQCTANQCQVSCEGDADDDSYSVTCGDCNDEDGNIHPGAQDYCDASGSVVDLDCDTTNNNLDCSNFCGDQDRDGYVTYAVWNGYDIIRQIVCGLFVKPGDCDDGDGLVYPGTSQTQSCGSAPCEGNHARTCDGTTGNFSDWSACDYSVSNGNGCNDNNACSEGDRCQGGVCSGTEVACPPAGICDDNRGYEWTGMCDPAQGCTETNVAGNPEACNNKDDNCDGQTDEGCRAYYRDFDGDGFGDPGDRINATQPPSGYVPDGTDCNDADPTINPLADEICDGLDNNCDDGSNWWKTPGQQVPNWDANPETGIDNRDTDNNSKSDCIVNDTKQRTLEILKAMALRPYYKASKCVYSMCVKAPVSGETVCKSGIDLWKPTTMFRDSKNRTVMIETSCSKCLYEGQLINGWNITKLEADAKMDRKCDEIKGIKPSCILEICVNSSATNQTICKKGINVTHPTTTFTDSLGNTAVFKTSCSECIEVNDSDAVFTITKITDNGKLTQKCRVLSKDQKEDQKRIQKAIRYITKSLGNRIDGGDRKIVWLDDNHVQCKDGHKMFSNERKAVKELEKVKDPVYREQTDRVIQILVGIDRGIANVSITEAPLRNVSQKDIEHAMKHFQKGESETKASKKIEEYRKAWKHVNKHCVKGAKLSCMEELIFLGPDGEEYDLIGDDISPTDTLVGDAEDGPWIKVKTSCSECLYIGQNLTDKNKLNWTVTDLIEYPNMLGTMAAKCRKP